MIGKKINQLATELAPVSTDLTIIGDPTTGVSKKITLAQLGAIFSGAVSFYTNLAGFPATGDINVIYCAKDTQKLYLWSGSAYVEVFPSQALLDTYQLRSEKGVSNGYASLDSAGKVPISQLPSSIMEYKGTWNAATNTPTLANGTGDTGDVYICNVAGTVNFGAGAITFAVGDYVIYSGSIWQRSSGAVGTVTSVAASITGDAIGITGSPITTSGTLAFAFAGTGAQYIKGDGTLATFPSTIAQAERLITEVYNSTGATLTKGTIVYINGGQGNLPTVAKALATGDSTSAQTFGVVQADITNNNNGYVVVAGKLSDLDTQAYTPGTPLYLSSTTAGTWTSTKQYAPNHLVYIGVVVRAHPTQGIVEIKIQNGYELDELHNVAAQTPTNNDGLFWESATSLWKNKSIATILGGTPVTGSGTLYALTKWGFTSGTIINSNLYDTGSVIYNNNATAGAFAVQFNGNATSGMSYGLLINAGSDANDIALRIQNVSSTSEYFFVYGDGKVKMNNIPNATTDTDTFLVSDGGFIKYRTGAQLLSDIGGASASGYVPYTGATTNLNLGSNNLTAAAITGSSARITTLAGSVYADVNGNLGTTAGTQNTIAYWGSQYSLASLSTTTYPDLTELSYVKGVTSSIQTQLNSKQSTLTNPVTGTGTTNYLPKFTGTSTIGNSGITDDNTTVTYGAGSGLKQIYINGGGYDLILGASGGGVFGFTSTNISLVFSTTAKPLGIGTNAAQPLIFGTSAAERMRLDASGNLMVGSANAGNAGTINVSVGAAGTTAGGLQLWAASNQTHFIQFGDGTTGAQVYAGYMAYAHSTDSLLFGTNGADKMFLNSSGNLGLGVSPSAWASGYKVAQYQGGFVGSDGTSYIYFGQNAYSDGTFKYLANGLATIYAQDAGKYIWYQAPTGTAGNAISFTQAMTLNASGNLSIGNTNDTYKLDVSGTGRFTGSVYSEDVNAYLLNQTGNTTDTKLWSIQNLPTSGQFRIRALNDGMTNGINAIVISRTGISSLSLDFTGAATFSSSVTAGANFRANNGGFESYDSSYNLSMYQNVSGGVGGLYSSSNNAMAFWTNATERIRITSGGNVLINRSSDLATGSSTSRLVVNGAVNVGSGVGNTSFGSKDDGGLGVYVGSGSNAFQVWDDNQFSYPRFIVQRAGNVGIGTASPSEKLEVNGNIKTAAPSGGSAGSWKLGTFTSGTATIGGKVRVEINGVAYDLLTT